MTAYYITVKRDRRTGWIAGPFACHTLAIALVPYYRGVACALDPWCDFDAFGTSSITRQDGNFPRGVLTRP